MGRMDQRWIRLLKISPVFLLLMQLPVAGMGLIKHELIINVKDDDRLFAQEFFREELVPQIWQDHILTRIPKNDHAWYWCACLSGTCPSDTLEFAQLIKEKTIHQETSYKNFKKRLNTCAAFSLAKNPNARIALQKALAQELALFKEESETWKKSITLFDDQNFNNYLNTLFESNLREQWDAPAHMPLIVSVPNNVHRIHFTDTFIDHVKHQSTQKSEPQKIYQLKQWKLAVDRLKIYNATRSVLATNTALVCGAAFNLVGAFTEIGIYHNTTITSWWYLLQAFTCTSLFLGKTAHDVNSSSSHFNLRKNFGDKLENCQVLLKKLIETIEAIESVEAE